MSRYEQITVELADRITTITLNRPERLNAWTARMAAELREAIVGAGHDPGCRCIVITGAGRGFCAGADMGGLQDTASSGSSSQPAQAGMAETRFDAPPGLDLGDDYPGRFGYFYQCPKPIIAAINGPCAGIGLVMTLYADLRYANEDARFTTAFAARGLIAEHGIAWLLPRLIGEANALDLLLTSRKFSGAQAQAMGLVNAAVSGDQLAQTVSQVATTLANDVSPRSISVMKRQVRAGYGQSFAASLEIADQQMEHSFSTFDFAEGVNSYIEKRHPRFRGE